MIFWHISNTPPWFRRVKLVVIPPRFIQPAVGCYNSWANLRCSGFYPLGEKSLRNRSISSGITIIMLTETISSPAAPDVAFEASDEKWKEIKLLVLFSMMTSSNDALLALCMGNSPVTGEFPSQRPVTRSFELRLNEGLSKQSRRRWFKTPSRSLWRHCNVAVVFKWLKADIFPIIYLDTLYSERLIHYFGYVLLSGGYSCLSLSVNLHPMSDLDIYAAANADIFTISYNSINRIMEFHTTDGFYQFLCDN